MGIGDWGLGIGDWAQSPIPIPNPQNIIFNNKFIIIFIYKLYTIIISKMAKGLAVGLSKGHVVTKIEVPSWTKQTPSKF